MIYLGCDPGVSGAIATSEGWVESLPIAGKPKARELDAVEFVRLLKPHIEYSGPPIGAPPAVCALETQWHGKKEGHARSKFVVYGGILATLQVLGLRVVQVPPKVWKRYLGLGKSKDDAVRLAEQEFDCSAVITGPRGGKDHNLAEALLLARYAEMYLRR